MFATISFTSTSKEEVTVPLSAMFYASSMCDARTAALGDTQFLTRSVPDEGVLYVPLPIIFLTFIKDKLYIHK
jgi:hypothetical protein